MSHAERKIDLVRHDDHGHPVLSQLAQDVQDLSHQLGIQRAGGLVKQHQLRIHGKRPGNGDTLLLSPRQLRGIRILATGQPDARQQSPRMRRTAPGVSLRNCVGAKAMFSCAVIWGKQIERLEYHPNLRALAPDITPRDLVSRPSRTRRPISSPSTSISPRWNGSSW